MLITPDTPDWSAKGRFKHGSNLNGNLCPYRVTSQRKSTILRLLDAAIFNLIIGNADAHAKNFSLLHKGSAVTLAPLYDLLSTVMYPELSAKLAMKIGGKAVLEDIEARQWERFAGDAKLGAPFVRNRVVHLCEGVAAAIAGEFGRTNADLPELGGVKSIIGERASRLLRTIG